MTRMVLAVAMGVLLAGCARNASSLGTQAEDPLGYYEVAYERSVYVLGSMQSVDKLRAGTLPPKVKRRFNRQGGEVLFEVDGVVLEKRLLAEYSRRHGSID